MKKTLFFLLGTLLLAMLPTVNVNAQSSGYIVTWKNHLYTNTDSTSINSGLIAHVPTSPYTDTLLLGWYLDSNLTIPWLFRTDTLSSNTTLWPKWIEVDSPTMKVFKVVLNKQGFSEATYPIRIDTLNYIGNIDQRVAIESPKTIKGFEPFDDSIIIASLPATDTIVNIRYNRIKRKLEYSLNWNGHFADTTIKEVQMRYYGETIVLPSADMIIRENCTFIGWQIPGIPNNLQVPYITMREYDINIKAMYQYTPLWTSNTDTTTMVYSGNTTTNFFAYYVNDNGMNVPTDLVFYKQNGTSETLVESANAVGTYRVVAKSPDPTQYPLGSDSIRYIVITPYMLTVSGTEVEPVKYYDGNSNATVTNTGSADFFEGDNVILRTTARYSDAAPGDNKSIVAFYSIAGADASNYTIASTALLRTDGVILDQILLEHPYFYPDGNGYCDTVAVIPVALFSGTPDQYKITFSDEDLALGFSNTDWVDFVPGSTRSIVIKIPAAAAGHYYRPMVQFQYKDYPAFASENYYLDNFHVNLPSSSVIAIFNNVLSIVDTCDCLDSFQWYKNGAPIPGANEAWYQDPDGLDNSNTYHVLARMRVGDSYDYTWSCDASYTFTRNTADVSVNASPNPASDMVKLSISNSPEYSHKLVIMNVMGMTVLNTVFEGNETNIDLRGLPHGTYTAIVDGMTVRVIKR